MKIALLLTGFLRSYNMNYYNLKTNLIDLYDCDIYCVTWDKQEDGYIVTSEDFNIYNSLAAVKIQSLKEYEQNKKYFYPLNRENDVFLVDERAKHHGVYWANRLKDQWKLVKEGYKAIKKPESYDIIFRLRYDINIQSKINLKINNCLNIPNDIGGWDFTDHMAYSDPEIMKKYCHLYDHIDAMYLNHNIDITHAVNMPKFYINQNNINWNYDKDIIYRIIK